MKFSWTSLKISLAGARLNHLAQKDRIWDHGSMTEQARIIFYLVQKAKATGNLELLKKQCASICFEILKREIKEYDKQKEDQSESPIIKEIAIIRVQQGKNHKPDMFTSLIKGVFKEDSTKEFKIQCSFIRQGDWWVLNDIKMNLY